MKDNIIQNRVWQWLCIMVLLGAFVLPAQSAIPDSIDYQGYLTDSHGVPLNSTVSVTFNLYNVDTDGVPLWTDTQSVSVTNGLFNVQLGSQSNSFPLDLFDDPLWLGIDVEGDGEMVPRTAINSSAFAFRAGKADQVADGAITSLQIAPGTITETSIAAGAITSDKLGITCANGEVLMNTASGWVCGSLSGGGNCTPGDYMNCYTGPAATLNVGSCSPGSRTCVDGLAFGSCAGEVQPVSELCDGADNDCDGVIDNNATDATTWYADVDNDGHGDTATVITACAAPAGYIATGNDCDDSQVNTYPGAHESCDGIDNDCNGQVDDACSDLACTTAELDIFSTCLADCSGNGVCTLTCTSDAGVTSTCTGAIGVLGSCGITAGCTADPIADEACYRQSCAAEYEALFGPPPPECNSGDTRVCGSNVGQCQEGTQTCVNGFWDAACVGGVESVEEICGDGIDNTCTGVIDPAELCDADNDGDGFTPNGGDCNDDDRGINPNATEVCDAIDNNCNAQVDEGGVCDLDMDGDGFSTNAGDCNDSNAAINPNATEVCDGIDNNCNGQIDEIAACSLDADGDGVTPSEGDCNDADASISPLVLETCDGIDNDCDGTIDINADDAVYWFADYDNDMFGNINDDIPSCTKPDGYIADSSDCDDSNASVNPFAEEVCDGIDNDCEGTIDVGAADEGTWYADVDLDGYGDPSSYAISCNPPVNFIADNTDCDDGDELTNPDAAEACDGIDNNCDGTVDELACGTDADGDGVVDANDPAPNDPYICGDTDSDSCDDCSITGGPAEPANDGTDTDADGLCDAGEMDDDNDGVIDPDDAAPLNPTVCSDVDSDGCDDCSSGVFDTRNDGLDFDMDGFCNVGDCDDSNFNVNPIATEVCDGIDNDCNGTIDIGAMDSMLWFQDADGDGYGDGSTYTSACGQPAGYVTDNTDCDDGDGSVNLDAIEVCDSIDNNCDAQIDEGLVCP